MSVEKGARYRIEGQNAQYGWDTHMKSNKITDILQRFLVKDRFKDLHTEKIGNERVVSPHGLIFEEQMFVDKKVKNAIVLAVRYQFEEDDIFQRKVGGHQDLEHWAEVATILRQYGFDADLQAAGFLHDLVEDSKKDKSHIEREIENASGPRVLRLVKAVTADKTIKDWKEQKRDYLRRVEAEGRDAVALSVADKIGNLRAFIEQYEIEGEAVWEKFNAGPADRVWFDREVLALANKYHVHHKMVATFSSLLARVAKLSGV